MTTELTTQPAGPGRSRRDRSPTTLGIVAGLLSAAVALGVAQLVAGITGPQGSPVVAVGGAVIDNTPRPVTDFVIKVFGTSDKLVLVSGIVVVLTLFAAGFGAASARRLGVGMTGLTVFAAIGLAAVMTRPDFTAADVAPTLAGAAAGAFALERLSRAAALGRHPASGRDAAAVPGAAPERDEGAGRGAAALSSQGRRTFIMTGAVAAATAAVGGVTGNLLTQRTSVSRSRALVRIPPPARPAKPPPAMADLKIPGLSPFVTPNARFYRVDTALVLPQVPPDSWRLRIHGMVNREVSISFDDLLRRPLIQADITLCCVSNPVGGPYISNARWLGVPLASVLRQAGIKAGADQLLSRSTDGYTSGTPVAAVMDGRNALLAVAMNGSPLPVAHGFPVRMVVPGLYGYVSATKWVTDIEVTTFAAQQAYWVQQGWAARGPVKTESRIDVPASGAKLNAGRVTVAGVAWAQHRGVAAVQVRVDGGPWHGARLASVPGIDTWRQWAWDWQATPGKHQLEVRATDETGYTQTPRNTTPFPSGATGWHTAVVSVSA